MDVDRNGATHQYSVKTILGDSVRGSSVGLKLLISTSEQRMAVFTTSCGSCNVPVKIQSGGLGAYAQNTDQSLPSVTDYFDNAHDKKLDKATLSGKKWTGRFNMQFWEYHREASPSLSFMGIDNANPSYTGDTSGFMGIAPYSADLNNKDMNFIYQLKQ